MAFAWSSSWSALPQCFGSLLGEEHGPTLDVAVVDDVVEDIGGVVGAPSPWEPQIFRTETQQIFWNHHARLLLTTAAELVLDRDSIGSPTWVSNRAESMRATRVLDSLLSIRASSPIPKSVSAPPTERARPLEQRRA